MNYEISVASSKCEKICSCKRIQIEDLQALPQTNSVENCHKTTCATSTARDMLFLSLYHYAGSTLANAVCSLSLFFRNFHVKSCMWRQENHLTFKAVDMDTRVFVRSLIR